MSIHLCLNRNVLPKRILIAEVRLRKQLAHYRNGQRPRLVVLLDLAAGNHWNLHRPEEPRPDRQHAIAHICFLSGDMNTQAPSSLNQGIIR
jgi:hypothetical protein